MRKKKFTALAVFCLCVVFGLAAVTFATLHSDKVAIAKAVLMDVKKMDPKEELTLSQKVITGAMGQVETLLGAVQKKEATNGAVQRDGGQINEGQLSVARITDETLIAAEIDTGPALTEGKADYLTISESDTGGMSGLIPKMTLTTHRQCGATIVAENVDMKSRNRGYETLMGGTEDYQVLLC